MIGGEVENEPELLSGDIEQPSSSASSNTLGRLVLRSGFDALHINCSFSMDNIFTFFNSFSNFSNKLSLSTDNFLKKNKIPM